MNELQIIENELVPVYKTSSGEKVVNGRELHTVLHSGRIFQHGLKRDCLNVMPKKIRILLASTEKWKPTMLLWLSI
nr:MAG TPA: hypothetical protein [Caudoviricetes sp.]